MSASVVAPDGKQCICFCFGGDVIVNWILFVGRVAIVQAEIAPVRSVPALCTTGSVGHNLVVTGVKKDHTPHAPAMQPGAPTIWKRTPTSSTLRPACHSQPTANWHQGSLALNVIRPCFPLWENQQPPPK